MKAGGYFGGLENLKLNVNPSLPPMCRGPLEMTLAQENVHYTLLWSEYCSIQLGQHL